MFHHSPFTDFTAAIKPRTEHVRIVWNLPLKIQSIRILCFGITITIQADQVTFTQALQLVATPAQPDSLFFNFSSGSVYQFVAGAKTPSVLTCHQLLRAHCVRTWQQLRWQAHPVPNSQHNESDARLVFMRKPDVSASREDCRLCCCCRCSEDFGGDNCQPILYTFAV